MTACMLVFSVRFQIPFIYKWVSYSRGHSDVSPPGIQGQLPPFQAEVALEYMVVIQ